MSDFSVQTSQGHSPAADPGPERLRPASGPGKSETGGEDPRLEKVCAELESLFISYLLKEMRATIPKSGFMDGGKAEESYTSMLDSQLARELALKGGIGLASIMSRDMSGTGEQGVEKTSEKPEQIAKDSFFSADKEIR